jgi:queuine tRNA-ribosyltransferase
MLGPQLLSIHNLTHYLELMRAIRDAIAQGCYEDFYRREKGRWRTADSSLASTPN